MEYFIRVDVKQKGRYLKEKIESLKTASEDQEGNQRKGKRA